MQSAIFVGLDALAKNLRGEVSLHDMRWQERAFREEEAQLRGDPASHKQGFLIDLFRADTSQRPRHELELPLLLAKGEAPMIKGGYGEFRARLNAFSESGRLRVMIPTAPSTSVLIVS